MLPSALPLLLAFSAAVSQVSAQRFEIADVCSVAIKVNYPGTLSGRNQEFVLSKTARSADIQIEPGTGITVVTEMKACEGALPPVCDTEGDNFDTGLCNDWTAEGGLAFRGESAAFSITGEEAAGAVTSIEIIAVDRSVIFDPITIGDSTSFTFPVIISGIVVSPGTLKYGQSASISVAAFDIKPDQDPVSYQIVEKTELSNSKFNPTGVVPGETQKVCQSSTQCDSLGFDAVAGSDFADKGNVRFTVKVEGENQQITEAEGNLVIDPRGKIQVGVKIMNIPEITTTEEEIKNQASFHTDLFLVQADGNQASTVSLQVKDEDFDTFRQKEELTENVTITKITVDKRVAEGTHQEVDCSALWSSTFDGSPQNGNSIVVPYSATFDVSGVDTTGGPMAVTACRVELVFKDNNDVIDSEFSKGVSAKLTLTFMVYPNQADIEAAKFIMDSQPLVTSTLLTPSRPSAQDTVEFIIGFKDPTPQDSIRVIIVQDSCANVKEQDADNVFDVGGANFAVDLESGSNNQIDTASLSSNTACSLGCRYKYEWLADQGGDFCVLIQDEGSKAAAYDSHSVTLATRRRRSVLALDRPRRAEDGKSLPVQPFSTSIVDGELKAELSPSFAAQMGETPPTTTTAPVTTVGAHPPTNGIATKVPPSGGNSASSALQVPVVVGAAGGVVVLLAVVALVVVKRRPRGSSKVSPAPEASFQAASVPSRESKDEPQTPIRQSTSWF